jgi:hypothetical protein
VKVGHAGCRDGLQQTEAHVLRELLKESATGARQDGHLVEDQLVDEILTRLESVRAAQLAVE